jgi:hypothetical protein
MRHRQSSPASPLAPRASPLAPRTPRLAPRASHPAPRPSRLAPRASSLAPRASRLSYQFPVHIRHYHPRAARGVVRVPRRFLAALGMTSRCARNDTHAASSIITGITPRLAPRPSRLAPRASHPAPRPSRLAPRASRLAPRTPRLVPRASPLSYQFPVHIRHGHPEQREGSCASRADPALRLP